MKVEREMEIEEWEKVKEVEEEKRKAWMDSLTTSFMDTLVETAERRLSHTARIPIGRSRVKGEMVLVLVPQG
uniref:Uncharacterized protein n=1 Tax=Vespula pensylvanica TaxID=30213 RepID=A0A834P443_VESPE|nr:hypothetical protein H0235_007128 [Vespula pensylvanica]